MFSPQGEQVSRYDKMHLFDAGVQDAVGSYRESAQFEPGNAAGWFEGPGGKWGLAVCYDLRFPEYFRLLSQAGCHFWRCRRHLCTPLGRHIGRYYCAPAPLKISVLWWRPIRGAPPQPPSHLGHSMIVNPWGDVVAVLPEGKGL